MNIAERIIELRRIKGVSQEQLADELAVSRQAVSKWETGVCLPETENLIKMIDYFRVSADFLLLGKQKRKYQDIFTPEFIRILILVGIGFIIIEAAISNFSYF